VIGKPEYRTTSVETFQPPIAESTKRLTWSP